MDIRFIEGTAMKTQEAAHDHLAKVLGFPDHYGRNLDALYDMVTEISEEMDLTVLDPAVIVYYLGDYGIKLLSTLREAVDENPNLILILI